MLWGNIACAGKMQEEMGAGILGSWRTEGRMRRLIPKEEGELMEDKRRKGAESSRIRCFSSDVCRPE